MARRKKHTSKTSKQAQARPNPTLERAEPTVHEVDPMVRDHEDVGGRRLKIFIGPLPHPDLFRAYHEIDPEVSQRIVAMAEKEQDHRHAQERKLADADVAGYFRGQNWAGIISLSLIGGMVYLFATDHTWQAAGMGAVSFGAVIIAFLKHRFVERPKAKGQSAQADDSRGALLPDSKGKSGRGV